MRPHIFVDRPGRDWERWALFLPRNGWLRCDYDAI
jgi:hypothetical protein